MNKILKGFFDAAAELPRTITSLEPGELFDADGVLMTYPAAFWEAQPLAEKIAFGHAHGLYAFPTTEIIATINQMIGGRPAIEIGAGNGGFARALGIPATDSYQQTDPQYAKFYEAIGRPTVGYGPHVEKLEATLAVAKYQPKVVLACWVTHLYDPRRHELGGNVVGVDEQNIMEAVDDYIFVGNSVVHESKPLFKDLNDGKIKSHRVSEFYVGNPMTQSISSRGLDFILRLSRV